jgi:hypothetical protein
MSSPFDVYLRLVGMMYSPYIPLIERAARLQREVGSMVPSIPAGRDQPFFPELVGENIAGTDKVIRPTTAPVGADLAAQSSPTPRAENVASSFQPFAPWFALAQTMLQAPLAVHSASNEKTGELRSHKSGETLRPNLQAVAGPEGLDRPLSSTEQRQLRADDLRRQIADIERQQEQLTKAQSDDTTDPSAMVEQMVRSLSMLAPPPRLFDILPSVEPTDREAEPHKRPRAAAKSTRRDQKRSAKPPAKVPTKKRGAKQGRR